MNLTSTISATIAAGFLAFSAPAGAADIFDARNDALADPVQAQNWTGPYIALGIGYEAFRSEEKCDGLCGYRQNGKYVKVPAGTILEAYDGNAIISGRIGYDQQNGSIVYGAFIEGNWLNLDSALGDAEWSYAPGARLGLLCGGALCYINGGWEFIELDGSKTIDNPFAGGGLEVTFGNGWGGALEGRYSFRDENKAGVDVKDVFSGRLMLIKKFD